MEEDLGVSLPVEYSEYEEALKSYRTYATYQALSICLTSLYGFGGESPFRIAQAVRGTDAFERIRIRDCNTNFVQKSLRNAWSTELVICRSTDFDSAEVVACANAWALVQAYYAIYHLTSAMFEATGWFQQPQQHRRALDQLAEVVTNRGVFPPPWNSYCCGDPRRPVYGGYTRDCSGAVICNLAMPRLDNAPEWIRMIVKTTHQRRFDEKRKVWLKQTKNAATGGRYLRMPPNRRGEILRSLAPSTIFDFFYRTRIRANYGDTDPYMLGPALFDNAAVFRQSLVHALTATMVCLEIVICAAIGKEVFEEALAGFRRAVGEASNSTIGQRESSILDVYPF